MFGTRQEFLERQQMWQRFNAWEAANPDWRSAAVDDRWNWFCEAWEMARRLNPEWTRPGIDMEKVERLKRIRDALAALEASDEKPDSCPGGNNPSA